MNRMVDPILAEIDQEGAVTQRLLERVPSDKLTWKPHPKSMSLGQLALHVATIPGGIAQILLFDNFDIPGPREQPPAKSASELVPAMQESLRTAKQVIDGFDDEKAMAKWSVSMGGKQLMALPRIGAVRGMILNHWYHHRGQLSVYLRLLDIPVPSIYGLSADENPWSA